MTDENGIPVEADRIFSETRNLIDTLSDNDPVTVDYFAVSRFNGATTRGWAFHDYFLLHREKLTKLNVVLVRAGLGGAQAVPSSIGYNGEVPRDFIVAAHELDHVILNSGHIAASHPLYGRNLMTDAPSETDSVDATKRLSGAQATAARASPYAEPV